MTGTPRIPEAEITGLYGAMVKRYSKRKFGDVPSPVKVVWHHKPVLKFSMGIGRATRRWKECDESLKAFAHMAVASLVGCSFCLDLGYFTAHHEGLDLAKAREVPRWRESDVFTPLTTADVAEDVQLAESLSIAMLTVLETLAPAERAVFVLREVFDVPYEEIAQAVAKSPAAVRQIAHRARGHVAARRPRMEVSRAEQQAAVESFRAAIEDGDLQGLLDSLAPDVVLVTDGGGQAPALPRPVRGVERVARVLAELLGRLAGTTPHARVGSVWLNGAPALWVEIDGKVDTAISLSLGEGLITGIYGIRNPHKLTRLTDAVSVSRTS